MKINVKNILASSAIALALTAGTMTVSKAQAAETLERADVEKIIQEYLQKNPGVVVDALNEFQRLEREREERASREALEGHMEFLTSYEGSPFIGPKDADMVLVEFFDYNCGFCKRALSDIQKLADEFDNLKIVFKEFPILSPDSEVAARYALAADEQGKYFEMHSALMEASGRLNEQRILDIAEGLDLDIDQLKEDKDSDAVSATIEKTREIGREIGVRGTPAFVVGDELVRGAVGYDRLKEQLETMKAE